MTDSQTDIKQVKITVCKSVVDMYDSVPVLAMQLAMHVVQEDGVGRDHTIWV